ncbi:MAG: hypothetical protein ACQER7_06335, partial [Bacteroidota bacterium]
MMNKANIVRYLIFITLLFQTVNIIAQEDISPPVLKNASVMNDEGDVELLWDLPENITYDIIISRDSFVVGNVVGIHTIKDTSIHTWIDKNSDANNRPRAYKLSYKDVGQDPNQEGQFESNLFNTIHTSINMDTCAKQNKLIWSRHVKSSWKDLNDTISFEKYNIYRSVDENSYTKIATPSSSNDTTFTDEDVEYNHSYRYYVEGVLETDTTIKSKSNRVSIKTEM